MRLNNGTKLGQQSDLIPTISLIFLEKKIPFIKKEDNMIRSQVTMVKVCLPELSLSKQEVVNILGKSRDKTYVRTVLRYFRILVVSLSAYINKALTWVKIKINQILMIKYPFISGSYSRGSYRYFTTLRLITWICYFISIIHIAKILKY